MTAEITYLDFQGQINDYDVVEDEQMEAVKRVERRKAARRSRPDAKGRINGKECHAFAFAAMFEEEIADDL